VTDAAVTGRPDVDAGEIPVGYVVLRSGSSATAADILQFVAARVATYKRIRRLVFVEAIPKSAAGKIIRRLLPS